MAIRFKSLLGNGKEKPSEGAASSSSVPAISPMSNPAGGLTRRALLPTVPRRASARYTRFVYIMKLVLPALAVTLIVMMMVWPQITREDKSFRIGIADINAPVGDEPSMVNARHVGTDEKQQPYTVTADFARNLDAEGNRVLLTAPKADILLEDGTWLIMSATEGIYQRGSESLDLTGEVTLFHDSGYEFRTTQATIDLLAGEARGKSPVRGQGPFGDLSADGFSFRDQGRTLTFSGNAHAVLYSATEDGEK